MQSNVALRRILCKKFHGSGRWRGAAPLKTCECSRLGRVRSLLSSHAWRRRRSPTSELRGKLLTSKVSTAKTRWTRCLHAEASWVGSFALEFAQMRQLQSNCQEGYTLLKRGNNAQSSVYFSETIKIQHQVRLVNYRLGELFGATVFQVGDLNR